jgi:hypothetical protein
MQTKPRLRLVSKASPDPEVATEHAARRTRRGGFPWERFGVEWSRRLRAVHANGSMWSLALLLQTMSCNSDRITITSAIMAEAGLPRQHKRRILERLEEAGLIAIEWRGRRAPIVTPFYPPEVRRR